MAKFGPTGKVVYERTYSRPLPHGGQETWEDTVERVVTGNLALVYGADKSKWSDKVELEHRQLSFFMSEFALLPAGRHLWATGVKGRQYLFNCHVAGWSGDFWDHFEFSFLRLMEGGGVGSNYSTRFISRFGAPKQRLRVHCVADASHADYEELASLVSTDYVADWDGCYQVEDSREGWAEALVDLLQTYYRDDVRHVDRVYDVGRVRPSGSPLRTFGGTASGPAPLVRMLRDVQHVLNKAHDRGKLTPLDCMEIDHAIAECVVSGGNRRSARMSMVEWDDPYIEQFLACKSDYTKHWTTNISVAIDNTFIRQAKRKGTNANRLHRRVVEQVLSNGEPGYWNRELSQVGEVGEVVCTNPCGEITLQEWENCNLGHINLDWFAAMGTVNHSELELAHILMTRFLIRATYADVNDPKQRDVLLKNRRIGVGHTGVQGYWAKQGIKYTEIPKHAPIELSMLYQIVRDAARVYSFDLRIPEPVKVTTVAPTGTISKLAGVSEGIHPIFARYFERRVRFSKRDPKQVAQIDEALARYCEVEEDYYDSSGQTAVVVYPTEEYLVAQVRNLGHASGVVQAADELTLDELLAVQQVYQTRWADNAVSFTANLEPGKYTVDEVMETMLKYLPGLKGTTLMVSESRPQSPYTKISEAQYIDAPLSARGTEDGVDEECANGACPVR